MPISVFAEKAGRQTSGDESWMTPFERDEGADKQTL
jgi:hypothetical protein